MATITQNHPPSESTVGQIGDICIDSITGRQFKCFAIYTTTTNKGTDVKYDWDEIYPDNSSGGSSGDPDVIAALQAANAELSAKNSELQASNTELSTKNSELESQNTELESQNATLESDMLDINAALEAIIGQEG